MSVDLVFTGNKDLWTRWVVMETGDDPGLAPHGERKLDMRQMNSVDKNGNEDGTGVGMSWFPGYAINLETGERLNIVFGEDYFLTSQNGNDMIWNPNSEERNGVFTPVHGGRHYVYVFNTRYDEGQKLQQALAWVDGPPSMVEMRNVLKDVLWVGTPFLNEGFELLPLSEGLIPTETKLRFRVARPYQKYWINGDNDAYPKYSFSTRDMAPRFDETLVAESALDLVNVVPNPYFAYSAYETNQLDNRVKITNLPPECVVSIFSLDGTLIRRFHRAVGSNQTEGGTLNQSNPNFDTSFDWDLKNHKNIPIANGIYLIHIDAGSLGERTLKWFGAIREINLDTF